MYPRLLLVYYSFLVVQDYFLKCPDKAIHKGSIDLKKVLYFALRAMLIYIVAGMFGIFLTRITGSHDQNSIKTMLYNQ